MFIMGMVMLMTLVLHALAVMVWRWAMKHVGEALQ
jgi:hypothetical protein